MSKWQVERKGRVKTQRRKHHRRRRQHRSMRPEVLEPRYLLSAAPQFLGDLTAGPGDSSPRLFVDAGGMTFFVANDTELWKTDGTAGGTVVVKDFGPGVGPTELYLSDHKGTLVLARNDWGADGWSSGGDDQVQIWKSDGTSAGTVLVKDFGVGSSLGMSVGAYFTTVGDALFLVVDAGDGTGEELWKSDLTESGTVQVKDINPGASGSGLWGLTDLNGTLFFAASDDTKGSELWKSDGSESGTVLVEDIRLGAGSSDPSWLTPVDGQLFFAADDGIHGRELWKSDGTASGTAIVKDIRPGSPGSEPWGPVVDSYSLPFDFEPFDDGVAFFADDGTHGFELWKSDGTAGGTTLVQDIHPGAEGAGTFAMKNVGGQLFFNADDGIRGQELWKSDGTAAGTILLRDIYPGDSSAPYWIESAGGVLFFNADDGIHGMELWRTDGTQAGTVMVNDLNLGPDGSNPFGGVSSQGNLFFSADDGSHGDEPFALHVGTQIVDFGDAPDSYGTLLASDGARHVAAGPILGRERDIEQDASAPLDGSGDDTNDTGAVDDEDGVSFRFLMAGQWGAEATVTVSNAPRGAKLDAWMDFNGNGTWDEPAERIADAVPVANGLNPVAFDIPSTAAVGTTYARFRLSSAGHLEAHGLALDGEVQDYRVEIQPLVPTLALAIDANDILENGGVTQATVRRNTGTAGQLVVTLASSDTTEAAVPPSVTIPDGSDSVTFAVTAVDDLLVDGQQTATITASAPGYQDASDALDVLDDEVTGQTYAFAHSAARVSLSAKGLFDQWWPLEPVLLTGSTEVQLTFEGPDGSAHDDDGNGLDEMATELTQLELSGGNASTGPITVRLMADTASLGQIEEQLNSHSGSLDLPPYSPGTATSSYDVFFQVDSVVGPLANANSANMETIVHQTPTGLNDTFRLTNGPVLLAEQNNPGQAPWIRIDAIDFLADVRFGSVRGQKWHDLNANGFHDSGEPGLDGWVVALLTQEGQELVDATVTESMDLNGDGSIDPVTERGLYRFDDVPPGNYLVVELGRAGWGRTVPAPYPPTPPAIAGPGPNWVEQAFAGTENLDMYAQAEFDWDLDGKADETVFMEGSVQVRLDNPEDPGTGDLDRVPAEITSLDFGGTTADGRLLWVAAGDQNPDYTGGVESLGQLLERPNDPALVDSFFDVFFEMHSIEGGQPLTGGDPNQTVLHNEANEPLVVDTTLDRFGVDGVLWESQAGVDLLDAEGAVGAHLLSFRTVYHDLFTSGFGPTYEFTLEPGQDVENFDFGNVDLGPLQFGLDYGDAPLPYPTLAADNGASHAIDPRTFGTFLGLFADPEPDGQPNAFADGDDVTGSPFPDDEDGVTGLDVLRLGESAEIVVQASTPGYLNAWLDFNADGDWDDPGERLFSDRQLVRGENRLSFDVPGLGQGGVATPQTYARLRFTADNPLGQLSYTGQWPNGEVEDYAVAIDHPPITVTAAPWSIAVAPTSVLPASDQVGLTAWEVDTSGMGAVDHMQQQWFAYRLGDGGPEMPLQSLPLTSASLLSTYAPDDTILLTFGGAADPFVADIAYAIVSGGESSSAIEESVSITNQSGGPLDLHWFEYTDLDLDPAFGPNTAELLDVGHTRQTSSILSTVDVDAQVDWGEAPNHWEIADRDFLFDKLNDPWPNDLADNTSPTGPANVAQAFQWDFSMADGKTVWIHKVKSGQFENVSLPGRRVIIIGPRWFDPAIAVGYDYESTDLNLASITLPVGYGDDTYQLYLPDGAGGFNDQPAATLTGGVAYDLTQHNPAGFSTVRILGIETAPPDGLIPADPADPLAFPTQFGFVGTGETTVNMDGIPETIYVDQYGGFAEEVNNGATAGVVEPGDQVTWLPGAPNQVTGLIFGDTAFDSMAAAQGYVAARDLSGLSAISAAPAAEIHGYKFRDLDGNGVLDGDDTRMSGVLVRLLDADGVIVDVVQTDQNGEFSFVDLGPGEYTLTEGSPGFAPTTTFPLKLTLAAGQLLVAETGLAGQPGPGQSEVVNDDLIIGNRPSWRNADDPYNVNRSSAEGVTPLDVLVLVQYINAHPGETSLPDPPTAPPPYYDVTGDGLVTPLDVLQVVNRINNQGVQPGEGEAAGFPTAMIVPSTFGRGFPDTSGGQEALAAMGLPQPSPARSTLVASGLPAANIPDELTDEELATPQAPRIQAATPNEASAYNFRPNLMDLESLLPDIAEDIDRIWQQA